MNALRTTALLAALVAPAFAQRQTEALNRGVVAVRKSSTQTYVSWRLSSDDPADVSFNLYRTTNGLAAAKLNATPLTATTDFTDTPGSTNLAVNAYGYYVRPVIGGVEQPASETAALPAAAPTRQYLAVPLRGDTGPNGPYDVKFAWVGDLDGDGDYDFVVDRLSTAGAFQQYLEAYTNDGTFLWRMAMGPNSVNQYAYEPGASAISVGDTDNVTVFDMDGDGRAEVMVRTANGVTVTNAAGVQVASVTAGNNTAQFLSVFNGQTGAELARATLPNAFAQHGTLTNKAMIAYLDGKRPSVVMYGYNRADSLEFYRQFTAWDYRGGVLSQRWTLPQNPATLPGAEGHQIRIADVDNDGKDEICDLGHIIDDNGTQLYNTELTHGDRFHIADINPDRPGLETFAIQQYNPSMLATAYFESASGKMIRRWYSNGLTDVGRGIALDISSVHKGYEMYSTQPGIFNARAEQIYASNVWAPEGLWWDGDLGREFIDGAGSGALSPVVNKFNASTGNSDRFYTIYNENGGVHQAYGGRPAFWGDLLGDWREEIVLVANDYSELRIYTTTVPATGRLYSLMQNPQYRLQATTKGYVQANYVDYYLGFGMPAAVPPPPTTRTDLTWSAGTWDNNLSASWKNNAGAPATFSAGSRVLFDLSGSTASPVVLAGTLAPGAVTFFNPSSYTLDGNGRLTGGMPLAKSGRGALTLTGSHDFTGATQIWDGALVINGQLTASPVTVRGGTWGGALAKGETGGRLAGRGTVGGAVTVDYRGAITPGAGMNDPATLTLGGDLTAADGASFGLDLAATPAGVSDRIAVAGNLTLSGTVMLNLRALGGSLAPGTYTLVTYGGNLTGSVANLAVSVPDGTPFTLAAGGGSIRLTVPVTRAPAAITWTGGNGGNVWDIATTPNWRNGGAASTFVSGDQVTLDATGAANPTITLQTALPVGSLTVHAETNYNLVGGGSISGSGGLVKSGGGTLTLSTTNNYTGPTTITGGVLAVDNLNDGGLPSSIGSASAAAANLVLNGGTLRLAGPQTNTNRSLTLGTAGGTISIPDGGTSLQIAGSLTGSGRLTKSGAGVLILAAPNTHGGGTLISAGTVLLASDEVNVSGLGSGPVILDGGTLSMTDSIGGSSPNSTWAIQVPAGSAGRLNADGRCTLSGALTGGGEFTFYSPYVRTDVTGSWAAFTGRIRLIADADGGDLRIMNAGGYPGAALDLGANTYTYYNSTMGSSFALAVGTLSGSSSAVLLGGPTSGRTLTWQVGGRNEDSTFAGTIANSTGPTALTKVGTGTLTLTGASTYTGATTVSAGRLQMNGSSGGSHFTVENGATLGGTGTITGNVSILAGGALEHRGTGAALAITGNLSFGASAVIRPAAGVTLQAGTFTVLTYTGSLTGTPQLSWDRPAGSGFTAVFDLSTPGVIRMTLSEPSRPPGPVLWSGSVDFNWDTATKNWTTNGTATSYQPGDTPFLTDSGNAASPINLTADVQPQPLTVETAQNYTLSGPGLLTGPASLVKSGSGTFTLTGRHTFTGGSTVTGGVLALGQTGSGGSAVGAAPGTGPVALAGGGEFRMASGNGRNFPDNAISVASGGTGVLSSANLANGYGGQVSGAADSALTLGGPVSLSVSGAAQLADFQGTVTLPAGGTLRFSSTSGPNGNGGEAATFRIDGTVHTRNSGGAGGIVMGALTGGGTLQGQTNTPAGSVLYQVGAKNLDTTFSGVVANGSNGTTALTKLGSGNLTLSGTSTHTGATHIAAGKLTVTGALGNSAVTVAPGATLGGTGTLAGPVSCSGSLAPGVTAGTLSLGAGLTLAASSTLDYDLGLVSDRAAVTGNLTLDGTVNVSAGPGFGGGSYLLISYTGILVNNLLEVGSIPPGHTAFVSTTTPGEIRLVVVPLNVAPQIIAGPTASATDVTGTSQLAVTAADDGGEENLTYTWSATGPAAVTISPNGTRSAKSAAATFTAAGDYTFEVTVRDAQGLTTRGSVAVTIAKGLATVTLRDLAAGYDGAPKPASATTEPAGLAVTLTYDGAAGPPVTPGSYEVVATVDDPNYSGSATGTLVISPRTFADWESRHFSAAQISAGESAPGADPDQDGLKNLAEFALGGDPHRFTAPPVFAATAEALTLTFQRPAWLDGVTFHAEHSDSPAGGWVETALEVLDPGADPETVRATVPLPSPRPTAHHLRLRFER